MDLPAPAGERRLAGVLLWTLYLLWPARGWGWFDGVPLTPVSALALCGVWWWWTFGARRPSWRIPTALLVLKVACVPMLAERGLAATYFATDRTDAPVERSLEYVGRTYTRVDPAIAFGPGEAHDLPLFFFNDFTRFNLARPGEREALPYAVLWAGYFFADADSTMPVFLTAESVHAELDLDAVPLLSLGPHVSSQRAMASLSRGWHHVAIDVKAPPGAGRAIRAGVVDSAGIERPFDDGNTYVRRIGPVRLVIDRIARFASWPIDVLATVTLASGIAGALLAALGVLLRRPAVTLRLTSSVDSANRFGSLVVAEMRRPTGARADSGPVALRAIAAVASLLAIVEAYWFARPFIGRMIVLGAGQDMLTYESFARDILLNGPLMMQGLPVGTSVPFYYQPLYPYVMALLHRIFGEGYFGIIFTQRLLVAVSVAVLWRITHIFYGRLAGIVGACVAAVVLYAKLGHYSSSFLSENVFVPLVCTWALLSILFARAQRGAWWRAAAVGGVATLSRSTLLLAWVPVGIVEVLARPRRRKAALVAASFGLMLAVVSVATVRNWVASRRFVPITTSFAINLYIGNRPPPDLDVPVHSTAAHRFYSWFAADDLTRAAVEFARHAPLAFARNLFRKALYTLGFFSAYVGDAGWSPLLVVVWVVALIGLVMQLNERPFDWSKMVPAAIAASHFAAVTIIFPDVYVDRLIVPFYALILPYAGLACWKALLRVST